MFKFLRISPQNMVILSVLITTLCLQLASSRRLSEELDNEVSALPSGNLDTFDYKKPRGSVTISQPPIPLVRKKVGEFVEFHCEATGSPPPTIQWYKGHMRITENESFEDTNLIDRSLGLAKVASRLVINYVLPRHEDDYYCVAEAGTQVDRKRATLIVPDGPGREMNFTQLVARKILGAHHQPRVTFWASAYIDVIGSDVILPCISVGNPKPDLVWINPNGKGIFNDEKFSILPNGELSIRSITWDDMGVYVCRVRNLVGEDEVETFLYPMKQS